MPHGRRSPSDEASPARAGSRAYTEKYAGDLAALDYTPDAFRTAYSVPVRVAVERVRSW